MLRKFYLWTSVGVLMLYGGAALTGWEFGTAKAEIVPKNVREAPGGYRAFHFWHTGFRGGK